MVDITEEFNKRPFTENFLEWFITHILSKQYDIRDIPKEVGQESRILTMQLNGVDLNPLIAIQDLERQFDDMVATEAKKLLQELKQEYLNNLEDKFDTLTKGIDKMIEEQLPEKYQDKDEWD